jgi:hypothetical protein
MANKVVKILTALMQRNSETELGCGRRQCIMKGTAHFVG